jgi:predicted deacylase
MAFFSKSSTVRLVSVETDPKLTYPLFEKTFTDHGPTLLVTAGMDGDEYDAIDAAYRFIDYAETLSAVGRLIVIPIINTHGFYSGTSVSPLDGKYPKHLYPGNPSGTPSEQLISAIRSHHVRGATAWIDLHGGSLTERLTPFVSTYKTGVTPIDTLTKRWISCIHHDIVLYDKTLWPIPKRIASDSTMYALSEAGDGAGRSQTCVELHLTRIRSLMGSLGMISTEDVPDMSDTKIIYTNSQWVTAPFDGLWDDETSILTSLDRKRTKTLSLPNNQLLWHHSGMAVQKGEMIACYAYGKTDRLS